MFSRLVLFILAVLVPATTSFTPHQYTSLVAQHSQRHSSSPTTTTTSSSLASSPPSSSDTDSTKYVRCTNCQTVYEVDLDQLGSRAGRRLECSVCSHSWFQSKDRVLTLKEDFELQPLPQHDLERIQMNLAEGKSPKFVGDSKLYVGNIPFGCTEEELHEAFSKVGVVGDITLVKDETGRPRGFGFVTLRERADGKRAIEELNGMDIQGRALMVRESNT